MKKKLLSILLITAIVLSASTITSLATNINQIIGNNNTVLFMDVPEGYWAQNEINNFSEQGIISGNGDGTFAPESPVTREQFCKMLVLTFKAPLSPPNNSDFSDVATIRWSYSYIEACKDFLTCYTNPFGGLPAFHPSENATREDIAVALVRMMGLTGNDVNNANYAKNKFSDGNSISPQLLPYVSLACERGLINGFPDGTFGPNKAITRAQTVAMLSRATKQAVTDVNTELQISANCVYSKDGKTVTIYIEAEKGTAVSVDGKKIQMYNTDGNKCEGIYTYTFQTEESKSFAVIGTKLGKTKRINLNAKYEIGTPTLNITQCPNSSTKKNITLKGTVSDPNHKVNLTINNENVYVDSYDGSWSQSYTLKEGKNKFVFVATNTAGKTVTVEKTVLFNVGGSQITITQCPNSSTKKNITLKGTVSDPNYKVNLTINNESVYVDSYDGSWSQSVTLKEGENKFVFVATNTAGKTVTAEKTVLFNVGGPQITITQCPNSSTKKNITLKGTVSDPNYKVTLTINNESVYVDSYDGSWSQSVTLKEGENKFVFVATNTAGKTSTEERTVVLNVSAPEIIFTNCPEVTQQQNLTIQGRINDESADTKLYINDQEVSVSYDRSFSKSVSLTDGDNSFVFRAVNTFGKSQTILKTIKYVTQISAPTLSVDEISSTVKDSSLLISGSMSDLNDPNAKVYVNDQLVASTPGSWSKTLTLTEGNNNIIIVATNSYGKSVTVTKVVTYIKETSSES